MSTTSSAVWSHVSDLARRPPVTVPADASLHGVARTLWQEEVGVALVRTDAGEIVGIISERDIVAAVACGRTGPETTAIDLMTSPVIAVAPTDSLYDAAVDMLDLGFRHVPVADGAGHCTGVISIRDALRPLVVQALGG